MSSQQLAGVLSNGLHTEPAKTQGKFLSFETEQMVSRSGDHRQWGLKDLDYHQTENLESKTTTPEILWLFTAKMKVAKEE